MDGPERRPFAWRAVLRVFRDGEARVEPAPGEGLDRPDAGGRRGEGAAPKLKLKLLAMAMSFLVVGCTSVSSTYLHRDEGDTRWKKKHLHGVPITLRVPTHLKIVRVNKFHLTKDSGNASLFVNLPGGGPFITHDVRQELIYTDKIFTVDLKRPAAGTLKYTTEFKDQYFSKIQSEIEDRTIKETADALDKILARIPLTGAVKTTGEEGGGGGGLTLTTVESIAASAIFALDDPALELKIGEFLSAPCPAVPPMGQVIPGAMVIGGFNEEAPAAPVINTGGPSNPIPPPIRVVPEATEVPAIPPPAPPPS